MANNDQIKTLYESFIATDDAMPAIEAFNQLKQAINVDPAIHGYSSFRDALIPHLSFKSKGLFTCFDRRFDAYANMKANAELKKTALISGAGPCGLRAAVEGAFLGLKIVLIELRKECTRHNILKIWKQTLEDLVALGISQITPGIKLHGHLHLGTREMQLALIKAALILGVQVIFGEGVCGILDPSFDNADNGGEQRWQVWTLESKAAREYLGQKAASAQELDLRPSETDTSRLDQSSKIDYFEKAESQESAIIRSPENAIQNENDLLKNAKRYDVDALIVAEGESSRLIRRLGFDRKIAKYGEAIGIVINLQYSPDASKPGSPEKKLDEYVVWRAAADWKQSAIGKLWEQGIEVQNMEYMRGSTHFIAVTTNTKELLKLGVINQIRGKVAETLVADNINFETLRNLARTIARIAGIPDSAPVAPKNGVQVFDFSCKGLCVDSYRLFEPRLENGGKLLVVPGGDALQNPYWPQGLGINRGFHNVLDALWASYLWTTGSPEELVKEEREFAFRMLNWKTFSIDVLQPGTSWTCDPITRYSPSLVKSLHMHDVESKAEVSSVPERYRKLYQLKL